MVFWFLVVVGGCSWSCHWIGSVSWRSNFFFSVNNAVVGLEADLPALNLLEDVLCDVDERFLDVVSSFRRSFEEEKSILLRETFPLLPAHYAAVFQIALDCWG